MKKLRLYSAALALLLAISLLFSACDLAIPGETTGGVAESTPAPTEKPAESTEDTSKFEDILNAAYALREGETLNGGELYTLTGVITSINTPFDAKYNNITITIIVGNFTSMPIMCYRLTGDGVDALKVGDKVTVTGSICNYKGTVEFDKGCVLQDKPSGSETNTPTVPGENPYVGMSKEEFYADYKPAQSLEDALYRSEVGFLSGTLELPGQYAVDAPNRPMSNGKYVRNTTTFYTDDGRGYIILDSNGNKVMTIYRGGAYITLEEVAAYMYAFGGTHNSFPANYTSNKNGTPSSSKWGEYLRVNHSYFKGDTSRYPYEPKLPNITGCGGDLQYYEMDIGTTGTVTPGYGAHKYNNGSSIVRGAARLVYARQDLNGNGVYEIGEVYVFYTHNHYNDFREYLNYYGGWGTMFGNITGGGTFDSKTNYNPTPYPTTEYRDFGARAIYAVAFDITPFVVLSNSQYDFASFSLTNR